MNQPAQQISFFVSGLVFSNLAKRGVPLNIRPAEYARRLFEAAYAARVAGERGEQSGDQNLDNEVKQVFLLADCEPEFIADSLGLPLERVKRILEGWRQTAKALVSGDAPHRLTGGGTATPAATENGVTARRDGISAPPVSSSPGSSLAGTPLPPPPPGAAGERQRPGSYSAEDISVIRNLWREGKTTREIAETIDRPFAGFQQWVQKHRDICPKRKVEG